MSYNRGEWSEAYVLLRLLGDGRIYAGNEHSVRIDSRYMDIKSVLKRNLDNVLECARADSVVECWLIFDDNHRESTHLFFPLQRFTVMADLLFNYIRNSSGSFCAGEPYHFLRSIGDTSIKAGKWKAESAYEEIFRGKTDIVLRVIDRAETDMLGFSIKSYAGSPPTLFNSAGASAFKFRIENCTDEEFDSLNNIVSASGHPDVMRRVAAVRERLTFVSTRHCNAKRNQFNGEAGPFFEWNLALLAEDMPKVIAQALLVRYGYYSDELDRTTCTDIIDSLERLNPLNKRNPAIYYRTKISDFVYASFGQMTASTEWNGTHIINGGYIEVKRDGECLYFRANSDDSFKSYLLGNTHFESPSTNPNKKLYHGQVVRDDTGTYLYLNFSVRF